MLGKYQARICVLKESFKFEITQGCAHFAEIWLKYFEFHHFVEFVLGRFSHFNIGNRTFKLQILWQFRQNEHTPAHLMLDDITVQMSCYMCDKLTAFPLRDYLSLTCGVISIWITISGTFNEIVLNRFVPDEFRPSESKSKIVFFL